MSALSLQEQAVEPSAVTRHCAAFVIDEQRDPRGYVVARQCQNPGTEDGYIITPPEPENLKDPVDRLFSNREGSYALFAWFCTEHAPKEQP